MIENVKIKNCGRFQNFEGIPDKFGKFNLLYGWNRSGKTTLSRIFAAFDTEKLPQYCENVEFEICLEGGEKVTHKQLDKLNIKVFNSDYVQDNLKFEINQTEKIFILGEENKDLHEELTKRQKEESDLEKQIKESKQKIKDNENSISKLKTDTAKTIKEKLKLISAYTATQLNKDIENNELVKNLIEDNKLNTITKTIIDPVEKKKINVSELEIKTPNLKEIQKILRQKVAPSGIIERLVNRPKIKKWVEEGRDFHKESTICFNCGKELDENFNKELDRCFSEDDSKFKMQIQDEINKLIPLNIELPRTDQLYQDLQDKYTKVKDDYNECLKKINKQIEKLKSQLSKKLDNRDKSLELEINYNFSEIEIQLDLIIKLINDHNNKKDNEEKEKLKNINLVKGHYIAVMLNRSDYLNALNDIKAAQKAKEELQEQLTQVKNRIDKINRKISESHKGAEKLNDTLNQLLMCNSEISIEVVRNEDGDDTLELKRNGNAADYLSEGEKSSIAFAHFIANLENKDQIGKKQDTIIFIDDPISSLDQNHIFSVFSCIQSLKEQQNGKEGYKQIFISTHNYELFRLIADLCKNKNTSRVFYVTRSGEKSIIVDIPDSLKKHKTEYNFMFYKLKNYVDEPNDEDFFIIGHCARRLLEIFSSAERPIEEDLRSKITALAKEYNIDQAISNTLYKIVNVESHTFFGKQQMDKSHIADAINQVFEFMKNVSSGYQYKCLEEIHKKAMEEEERVLVTANN